jgi:hypothetical protein
MDTWLIIVLAVVGVFVVLALLAPPEAPAPPALPETDRVRALCAQLTGDPVRDRAVMNSVLALGPRQVPCLLDVLSEAIRYEVTPARLARLEDLLADFGLAALPPLAQTLARLRPTSPLAASVLRVVARLGRPGLADVVVRSLNEPALAPFLPRLRNDDHALADVSAAVSAVLAARPAHAHPHDLHRVVGLIAASARLRGGQSRLLDDLWAAWGSEGRVAVLAWLCDWLPLARPDHLVAGLSDPSDAVRAAAARLATLLVVPTLVPALAELATTGDEAGRLAAVHALAAWPQRAAQEALVPAAGDPSPEVAAAALAGLATGPADLFRAAAERAQALPEGARQALACEAPFEADSGNVLQLLTFFAPGPTRQVVIALLGRHIDRDPRALERLIQVAAGEEGAPLALRLLAVHGSPAGPELLARALEQPTHPSERLRLQEVAQLLGGTAAAHIARRLAVGPWLATQLAVLRAQDCADAVPALLHLLEECREGEAEAALAATLALGGHTVQEALDEALRLPGRGLLAPALHFLQAYATSADLPRLIELFDRHPPLRTIVLALIELQGPAALPALEARLARGGDDSVVLMLERRIAVLRETTGRGLPRA